MSAGINRYKADLREMSFVLFEQFRLGELARQGALRGLGRGRGQDGARRDATASRARCSGRSTPSATARAAGSRTARCTTPGLQGRVEEALRGGLEDARPSTRSTAARARRTTLQVLRRGDALGRQHRVQHVPGLTYGAAEVIAEFGTPEQKQALRASSMFNGKWGGTMCLTEPHAGSRRRRGEDAPRSKQRRRHLQHPRHQDLHLRRRPRPGREHHPPGARARRGAPPGTKGLSLFIVPKLRVNADGTLGERNDVSVGAIEHKMGINGSATCVLNFGENDGCVGELVGTVENQGMAQMFKMMNGARIARRHPGPGASRRRAYLNALEYAKERKQGAHYQAGRTRPRRACRSSSTPTCAACCST